MRQLLVFLVGLALLSPGAFLELFDGAPLQHDTVDSTAGVQQEFGVQWERSYGPFAMWSARYEGPQPVGDADNDGKNELLIGGRDPFMRVMKYDEASQTYQEQARIMDPILGIGYTLLGLGSATGFFIGDADNDGDNDVGVAWGRHFSAFEWDGSRYQKIGQHIVTDAGGWETTLDCMVGDVDTDGRNEVVVTGGYRSGLPEVLVLEWDGTTFTEESNWNAPGSRSVYFPWIADVDEDGENEIIVNTNETVVLNWDGAAWQPTVVARYDDTTGYPFGCVSKDSDGDGKPEIHVTFYTPELAVYEWTGDGYEQKYH
ncbi:MAG: FG-GAP-like repeat-containing protein, partial [Thermoplasmatota archaeon]